MLYALAEVLHHAALLPLLVLGAAMIRRHEPPPILYTVVATGLGISWLADSYMAHAGSNVWWMIYFLAPMQAALIFWGIVRTELGDATRLAVLSALAMIALASTFRTTDTGPELVAQAVSHGAAAFVVIVATHRHGELGILRSGLAVYFGLGAVWMVVWALTWGSAAFTVAFFGYQATRMVGLAMAASGMWRFRPRDLRLV